MGNALTLIGLLLQNATQLQGYAGTLGKAISEGRDVSDAELAAARGALQAHIDELQALINRAGAPG